MGRGWFAYVCVCVCVRKGCRSGEGLLVSGCSGEHVPFPSHLAEVLGGCGLSLHAVVFHHVGRALGHRGALGCGGGGEVRGTKRRGKELRVG